MLGKTHIAIGVLGALILLPFIDVPSKIAFIVIVAIGALLPDIDHEKSTINKFCPVTRILPKFFKHRGFFHSIFPVILLYIIFWAFNQQFVGLALIFGYLTHLAADSLTKMGVNYLHPFSTWHMRGPVETGTLFETFIFIAVIAGIIAKLVF